MIIWLVGTYETSAGELVNLEPKEIEDTRGSIVRLFEVGKLHNCKFYFISQAGKEYL